MLRPLALIGTVGMMAMSISAVHAQQNSNCPTCNNTGSADGSVTYGTGTWHYADCECDDGHCHFGDCSLCRTKAFPDKGWNPPAMLPINRDGIWYHNYWPQAWYGNRGGGFISDVPMVYQPTDTTQLGYSYAKVPTWTSANMIPPAPCPAHYHARVCVPREPVCRLPDPCQNGACRSGHYGYMTNMMPGSGTQQQPVPEPKPEPVAMAPMANGAITQMSATAVQAPVRPANAKPAPSVQRQIRPVSRQKTGKLFDLSGLKTLFR